MKINNWQERDKLQDEDLVIDNDGVVCKVYKHRPLRDHRLPAREQPEETWLMYFSDEYAAVLNERLTSVPFPLTLVQIHEVEREEGGGVMRVLWGIPAEPGPEVTHVSINGHTYTRYPKQGSDSNDWWRLHPQDGGDSWSDLISTACWVVCPILDATP